MAKKPEPKTVEAVGTAGAGGAKGLGRRIQEAMDAATIKAMEDGITDPDEIRELKLKARGEAKEAHAKEEAERLAAEAAAREGA